VRLFIAALLPGEIRKELSGFINSLSGDIGGVRWEKPKKLHITLKFLGSVDESRIDDISAVISRIVLNYSPFDLSITEFGAFPNLKNPRVLYAGLTDNKRMSEFQSAVEESMIELGFEKDSRKFAPHVTLGRVKKMITLQDSPKISQVNFEISRIGLMKSDTRAEGSVYTALKIFELNNQR
jgi:2'-5' RNA ligase